MSREPRRVERHSWPVETRLDAQDGDIDEMHRLRLQADKRHDDDIGRIDRKFDSLTAAITRLSLIILTGIVALTVDILKGVIFP